MQATPRHLLGAIGVLAGALALAGTASGAGGGPVTTVWDCTNGDIATFDLPAVAVSPGAGPLVAPFPGFLRASIGPVSLPLGTYVVLAVASDPSGPFTPVGRKAGLQRSTLTCTLEGATVTVIVAPAAHE